MRTLLASAFAISLLGAAVTGTDLSGASSAVRIADFAFSPTSITVNAGDSVTWTNSGPATHTTTADAGAWNSGPLRPGASYTQSFPTAGTFSYHCMIHPTMMASVTVVGGSQALTQPSGPAVTYSAGWNIVAGPTGTMVSGSSGPLYTFGATDSSYEMLTAATPLVGGSGYWAYFATAGSATFPAGSGTPASIQLPAGHYVLIGNPTSTAVTVSGADSLQSYDPVRGYQPVTTLRPGQGAWAYSAAGAALTVTPA